MENSEVEKTGSKINSWLVDEEYLKTCLISKEDFEHFKQVCDFIYTKYFVYCPIPLFISFDKQRKRFYFSVGNKFCILPYFNNISPYDYSELLQLWSYRFYPGYEISINFERSPTSEEIAGFISSGIDQEEAFSKKVTDSKIEKCVVEKIIVKEDQITVNLNNKKYIALSRADKPISEFIREFRKLQDPYQRKNFLNEYTKNILEVTFLKNIDIKIDTKYIENFFKIRVANNFQFPLIKQDNEGFVYKWGRFTIYFARYNEVDTAKKIIKYYRENFQNSENIDAYLKREFGLIFGVKDFEKDRKNNNK